MQPPEQHEIDELQRLEALYVASGGVGRRVAPSEVIGGTFDDSPDVWAWLRDCETRGLVELDTGLVPQVRFAPAGRQRVADAQARRENRGLRREVLGVRAVLWQWHGARGTVLYRQAARHEPTIVLADELVADGEHGAAPRPHQEVAQRPG
jgi:hypothetical protein